MARPKTKFVVQTAAACMPSTCWGQYRRVAVLEIDARLKKVAMLSERAKGCRHVVELWDRLSVGTTARCAYQRALRAAEALAAELNSRR